MIGIDLVFVPEFQNQLDIGGSDFMQKAFNATEIKDHNTEHLAGIWAAKEAVIKAAANAPKKLTDIIITQDKNGKPSAKVASEKYAISISHHGDYAVAIAYRQEK